MTTTSTTRRTLLRGAAAGAGLTALGTGRAPAAPGPAPGAPPDAADDGPHIGVLLYDGFSLLDPTGPAEILARLPGARVTMIAERRGPVRTDTGDVALVAERTTAETSRLDVLLVPGAGERGTVACVENPALLDWIRRVHRHTRWTTSVCTGSLILGAAGLLRGLDATTYWASRDYLENECGARYLPERYVRAGKIITAAGVSAGVDMALYLASLMSGDTVAQAIQLAVEYDPRPPFDTGTPDKAGPELRELALRLLADSQT
ncbi:DJ-1/PfpI family protein [Streptomyces specialis]|uniref:DJ-1/PfpI family protein n=1 Tax=Streptomyces specialis TaxID=498367 RepID=UPI00073E14C1|nr:DJ-1/PfpI family protein [Streptomyces specialis]